MNTEFVNRLKSFSETKRSKWWKNVRGYLMGGAIPKPNVIPF